MFQTESHERHKGKFCLVLTCTYIYVYMYIHTYRHTSVYVYMYVCIHSIRFQGVNIALLLLMITSKLLKYLASRPRDIFVWTLIYPELRVRWICQQNYTSCFILRLIFELHICKQAHMQEWMRTFLSCGHAVMYLQCIMAQWSTRFQLKWNVQSSAFVARSLIPTKFMLILCSTSLSHKC